jgi:hypothetical protein
MAKTRTPCSLSCKARPSLNRINAVFAIDVAVTGGAGPRAGVACDVDNSARASGNHSRYDRLAENKRAADYYVDAFEPFFRVDFPVKACGSWRPCIVDEQCHRTKFACHFRDRGTNRGGIPYIGTQRKRPASCPGDQGAGLRDFLRRSREDTDRGSFAGQG